MGSSENYSQIATARIQGESKVGTFNPDSHPGIIYRALLAGFKIDQIAAILGISPTDMNRWLSTYPELVDAQRKALTADAEVVASLYDAATGYRDPKTQRRKGYSVQAQIFWIKSRLGWRQDPKPPDLPDPSNLSPAALAKLAQEVRKSIDAAAIQITPADPDEF